MVPQRFYGCLFCSSKKSLFEKMSNVGRFIIGECVTTKAIHVLHLSECACRYGSDKKTKRLVGLVVTNVNIPTATGRGSFPSEQINLTIRLTNSCLHVNVILITRLDFTSRANLWLPTSE